MVEQFRAVQEGVAVDAAEAGEARLLQAGDHVQHAALLAPLQLGLEADQVAQGTEHIVLTELRNRPGPSHRARVGQADRRYRRSEERRVEKERVRTCRIRWTATHQKTKLDRYTKYISNKSSQ